MQGRNAQVARIYRILNLLEGAPQGLAVSELRERLADREFDVSKRTIYRDLEALSGAGFPVYETESRWVLERGTKVSQYLALTSQELFALYLARGMFVPLKNTPLYADLESVFAKIEEKLGTAHREHFSELAAEVRFDSGPSLRVELDGEVLETVRAACAEGQVLSVDYDSASSGTRRRRKLGPHYVYFAKGSVYLIAEDLAAGEMKVFAVPRMRDAVMEAESYDRKPFDHEKFFESSFGVYHGEKPVDVRIAFGKKLSSYVRERKWHPSQRTVERPDGTVEVSMSVALTPELEQWVLGFGADAQVLVPEDLRARLGASITKMAGLYAGSG